MSGETTYDAGRYVALMEERRFSDCTALDRKHSSNPDWHAAKEKAHKDLLAFGAIKGGTIDPGRVCMPLVRLMLVANLSWSDREEIAWAIRDSIHAYQDHEKEQQHLHGAAAGQVRSQGGGSDG